MATTRMIPPPVAVTVRVNGRSYTGAPGTAQDVLDVDADLLEANGWTCFAADGSGTTAQRPATGLFRGMKYADTTLGYGIVYDGAGWRNMAGAAV